MPFRIIRSFIKLESRGGLILFFAALLAVFFDNSPWMHYYQAFFHAPIKIAIAHFTLEKPLLLWINDGLMSVFFLLVGLEIKREMLEGELRTVRKATLPAIAAMGGMLVPAAIYITLNRHHLFSLQGWAIPTATDTAFSLAILSLLGRCIPVGVKIFLTALAIFDDIGAILVMAFFYSGGISYGLLVATLWLFLILLLLNRLNVQRLGPYFFVGFILWACVLKSGVHATLAGLILAWTIPLKNKNNPANSALRLLEKKLHPWVAWFVLPIFAFANAGVTLTGATASMWFGSVSLGIASGLFLGKQVGIWGVTMLSVRMGVSRLPEGVTPFGLYGLSLVAGVGFTMSLFIGTLAFHSVEPYAAMVRMGVILGSFASGITGYWILRLAYSS